MWFTKLIYKLLGIQRPVHILVLENELMAISADVQAIVDRINAVTARVPAAVGAAVAAAEAQATQDHADDVGALGGAVTGLEAAVPGA